MNTDNSVSTVMKQLDYLALELSRLKRVLLHSLPAAEKQRKMKPSLFGSVKGGDITDSMVEASKTRLFRKLGNI